MTEPNPPAKKQKTEASTQAKPIVVIVEKDGDRYRCMFTLAKKGGRQCNMTRKSSDKYCAQHKLVSIDFNPFIVCQII